MFKISSQDDKANDKAITNIWEKQTGGAAATTPKQEVVGHNYKEYKQKAEDLQKNNNTNAFAVHDTATTPKQEGVGHNYKESNQNAGDPQNNNDISNRYTFAVHDKLYNHEFPEKVRLTK